jgi:hypothetical protein
MGFTICRQSVCEMRMYKNFLCSLIKKIAMKNANVDLKKYLRKADTALRDGDLGVVHQCCATILQRYQQNAEANYLLVKYYFAIGENPLTSVSSDCVVFDTVIEDMPADMFPDRPWGPGNNPKTALRSCLKDHPEFENRSPNRQ